MIIDSNNEINEHILIIYYPSIINGHAGTDLLKIPIPYRRPIFEGYVREYPYKIWPSMVQYLHKMDPEWAIDEGPVS